MTTFIKIPFASSGDKTNPPSTDASGGVNWTQGYPVAYSKDPATDPSAKRIEREMFNGLLNRLSSAINEIQQNGVAPYISAADNGGSAFAYGKGVLVIYNGELYKSMKTANTTVPTANNTDWKRMWALGESSVVTQSRAITASTSFSFSTLGSTSVLFFVTGGGGAGNGCNGATSASATVSGAGGGGGGTAIYLLLGSAGKLADITIGGGGTPSAGPGTSGDGGDTILKIDGVEVARGGGGKGGASPGSRFSSGGVGGVGSGTNAWGISGGDGEDGQARNFLNLASGGGTFWGGGPRAGEGTGRTGGAPGAGGSAAYDSSGNGGDKAGGAGRPGVVYFLEFL